ncbi:putative reverse transcriptase domain-containing protein [Tanacetum coccineum]|uniref:Reverse transcriptase domain-containing protein n=1 Tax=Tanacetum coccineum TaxID=301880 RepID=A0ABQ5DH25_9ASTR
MDDPNITMEEYIMLEEEKARRRGKVFNWETTKYGKIQIDEDVHNLRSVETKFPAITLINEISSENTLSCEPMVSSLNNEVDFRISFDDSDDEDYTENDNEKVNMPSLPSHEPTVSCFDDLDFFNDFENEFPAIVYNDALTSKSDMSTEPTLYPQHIDDFDLKDETSLSEYDEKEQNVLYFNDLFPFNIVYPDDLKSDKGNNENKVDMIQSSGGASVSVMPLSTDLNLGLGELAHTKLAVELANKTVKYPKGIAENLLVGISKFVFLVDFIILDILEDIKVPLILGRLFLSIARAKIDVFKRKITLRNNKLELDLEARLMGETLVINRSLDLLNEDYIELNDLNEPFELKRNQGDDLMPTIKEGGKLDNEELPYLTWGPWAPPTAKRPNPSARPASDLRVESSSAYGNVIAMRDSLM